MSKSDKNIWDKLYLEEYLGLHETTQIRECISEEEYQALRPVIGNALLSMAISQISKDKNGRPNHVKYHIVALGNLDPHDWTNSDCFAPVMSLLELCLLIAIST